MATFQGTDLSDILRIDDFPPFGLTKDGQPLNPLLKIQASDVAGNDTIDLREGDDEFAAGAGDDSIILGAGSDIAFGGEGNDSIDGGKGDDQVTAGAGSDSIILGPGNNTADGGEGSDTIFGGVGTNTIDGGKGDDYLSYEKVTPTSPTGSANIFVDLAAKGEVTDAKANNLATDNITAVENVIGALGLRNSLLGTAGDNILIGGNAGDDLTSGGGKDILKGGLGDEFYTVLTTSNGTRIEDTGGNDTLILTGVNLLTSGPSTTGYGLERQGKNLAIDLNTDGKIDLTQDLLIVDFYADATSKTAGAGLIENLGNLQGKAVLDANIPSTGAPTGGPTTGSNVIWTTPTATIPGNPGPDVAAPGGGNATFDSQGVQSYVFTNVVDKATVPATAAGLYIQALNGNDIITGTAAADNINGNLGDDQILGGAGNDGDLAATTAPNTIRTALRGGKGSDNIDGQDGNDLINGSQDNDTVLGGAGDDLVRGGKGDDVLDGGAGADYLIGDAGKDKLTGGADADIFVLPGTSAAATTLDQADLITDFLAGTDTIMLPTGTTFAQLTLAPVTLQIDGAAAVPSTVIQSGTTFYALVQGVTPTQLTAANFVADAPNITGLG